MIINTNKYTIQADGFNKSKWPLIILVVHSEIYNYWSKDADCVYRNKIFYVAKYAYIYKYLKSRQVLKSPFGVNDWLAVWLWMVDFPCWIMGNVVFHKGIMLLNIIVKKILEIMHADDFNKIKYY